MIKLFCENPKKASSQMFDKFLNTLQEYEEGDLVG